jgi:hypothetical protein
MWGLIPAIAWGEQLSGANVQGSLEEGGEGVIFPDTARQGPIMLCTYVMCRTVVISLFLWSQVRRIRDFARKILLFHRGRQIPNVMSRYLHVVSKPRIIRHSRDQDFYDDLEIWRSIRKSTFRRLTYKPPFWRLRPVTHRFYDLGPMNAWLYRHNGVPDEDHLRNKTKPR